MKNKELEFNINGNLLEISDFTWLINKINAIYISRSQTYDYKECFAIFIQTDNEVDRLYYLSKNIKAISKQFKKLCSDLKEVNPNFKIHGPRCFNFANIKNIESSEILVVNMVPGNLVRVTFKNGNFAETTASEDELKSLIADKEEIEQTCDL